MWLLWEQQSKAIVLYDHWEGTCQSWCRRGQPGLMETHVQLKERDSYAGVGVCEGGHIFLPYCTVLQRLHHNAGCNFVY